MNDYTEIGGLSYANSKTGQTRKNGLTVKDLIVMGVFGALLMVCSMIGGVLFAVTPTLTFISPSEPLCFRGQYFTSSCKSAKALGIDDYWGHYFSA